MSRYPAHKGVTCQSVTNSDYVKAKRISSLTVAFDASNSQQNEMLINQLREITGIQDPQILYRALSVRPKISLSAFKAAVIVQQGNWYNVFVLFLQCTICLFFLHMMHVIAENSAHY